MNPNSPKELRKIPLHKADEPEISNRTTRTRFIGPMNPKSRIESRRTPLHNAVFYKFPQLLYKRRQESVLGWIPTVNE
jgi:hypothetical protein